MKSVPIEPRTDQLRMNETSIRCNVAMFRRFPFSCVCKESKLFTFKFVSLELTNESSEGGSLPLKIRQFPDGKLQLHFKVLEFQFSFYAFIRRLVHSQRKISPKKKTGNILCSYSRKNEFLSQFCNLECRYGSLHGDR